MSDNLSPLSNRIFWGKILSPGFHVVKTKMPNWHFCAYVKNPNVGLVTGQI